MKTKRKPVVGLSLKMYQTKMGETLSFIREASRRVEEVEGVDLFFCPSIGALWAVAFVLEESKIRLGTQNIGPVASGAYTGEFSIESLIEMGGGYVEIGHSERRLLFQESDEMIAQKIALTLSHGLTPVVCIGEKEKDLTPHARYQVLATQLFLALGFQEKGLVHQVIVAYEPVWAIGQTLAASSQHVHQAHQQIRQILGELLTPEIGEQIRIIYGGSVSQENVALLVAHPDVDGVFVGRFGHEPERYQAIVETVAHKVMEQEGGNG